jgi:predicted Zn-dependent protease
VVWETWRRGHGLTDAAWDEELPEQVYARAGDARVKAAVERIGRLVSREAPRNAYGLGEIHGKRRLVGECHAVDLAEADLLERAGRDGDAETVLERLAARERKNPWGPLRLSRLHLRTGRPGEAVPRLREAADLAPRNPEVHSLLGDALRHLRKRVAAEEAYGRALALDPSHAAARRGLSRLVRTAAGGARR